MTSLIIHLPDELAEKAKKIGLLNPELLTDTLSNFLIEQIEQQQKIKSWDEFFRIIDQCKLSDDFLTDREQPVTQQRPALEDLFSD